MNVKLGYVANSLDSYPIPVAIIEELEKVNYVLNYSMAIERKPSVYIIIKGKVQGVSFRYFTLKQAQELNIVGWVRNKPNGTVEAVAQGDKINLELFIKKLKQGSSFSRVDDVILNWEHEEKDSDIFSII